MRELSWHRHVQVAAEHWGCTWKVCLQKGWKEGETAMWLRGVSVNLFTSRAGLSDQSVSGSNSKPFRYLVFFSFSMLDTLEEEKQMFPPIWSPKRFLKQNQLLKEDKWFYLDWHEKQKSSCLRPTHHHPLTQLISLHWRPSHWRFPLCRSED